MGRPVDLWYDDNATCCSVLHEFGQHSRCVYGGGVISASLVQQRILMHLHRKRFAIGQVKVQEILRLASWLKGQAALAREKPT